MPVPERETVSVPSSGSLLVTVKVADLPPSEVGLNVTITGWLDPAATLNEEDDTVNWPPEELIVVTDSSALPVLEIVSV